MNIKNETPAGTAEKRTEKKYLTFWSAEQLFGIPITNVEQIVGLQEIVSVPHLPLYAKGIINLRGNIIPVIDMRLRLDKPEKSYTSRTCIVVTNTEAHLTGFIVDLVDGVIDVPFNCISEPPQMEGPVTGQYVTGIACLPGENKDRIILLLDLRKIMSEQEKEAIAAVK
ncbi:MAG: purine-binding chemotaxis protein CheW [Clostridiales bacterium]|nr:purine-binding chemotaxis protein CheW [Clostridiales bacterium]